MSGGFFRRLPFLFLRVIFLFKIHRYCSLMDVAFMRAFFALLRC